MSARSMVMEDGAQKAVLFHGIPIGAVMPYAGYEAPSGYDWCAGQDKTCTTNQELLRILGGVYGIQVTGTNFMSGTSGSSTLTASSSAPALGTWILLSSANTIFNFTIPAGMSNRNQTPLYVLTRPTSTTFTVSLTAGGSALVCSATGNGGVPAITFNLPDLRGRIIGGRDNMDVSAASRLTNAATGFGVSAENLGAAGGSQSHTLTITEMPSHAHSIPGGQGTVTRGTGASNTASLANGNSAAQGGGGAHNNVQPTLILNYIIRTS